MLRDILSHNSRQRAGEAGLHADYFGRKTDEQFAAYCAAKPHNAVSLDELPALPLPLPALPLPVRAVPARSR
jgi:hypothetical protein